MGHLLSIIIIILISNLHSVLPKTIEVQPENNGQSLQWAASSAQPGDTILLLPGEHKTGQYISELHGADKLPIIIMSEGPEPAVFKGGNQAIHFSDVSFLTIINIEFRK